MQSIHAAFARRSGWRRLPTRAGAGFSLLEVLVAIVVLSFGVLGMVGLQAASLQANKEARFQSSAVRLAHELGDLMRGNYAAAAAAGNPYLGGKASAASLTSTTPPENCYTQVCSSAANIASFQKYEWATRLVAELPGAWSEVCFDVPAAGSATQWGCTGTGNVLYVKLGWTRQSTDRSNPDPDTAASNPPLIVMPVLPQ